MFYRPVIQNNHKIVIVEIDLQRDTFTSVTKILIIYNRFQRT